MFRSGLRVLWIDQENYDLVEVAYFDVFPDRTTANFAGSWSNYPYYNSGRGPKVSASAVSVNGKILDAIG